MPPGSSRRLRLRGPLGDRSVRFRGVVSTAWERRPARSPRDRDLQTWPFLEVSFAYPKLCLAHLTNPLTSAIQRFVRTGIEARTQGRVRRWTDQSGVEETVVAGALAARCRRIGGIRAVVGIELLVASGLADSGRCAAA